MYICKGLERSDPETECMCVYMNGSRMKKREPKTERMCVYIYVYAYVKDEFGFL
jgi:hypothetical protein